MKKFAVLLVFTVLISICAPNMSGSSSAASSDGCAPIQIALTFDDGPGPYTGELLDFFGENGVKATFFLVGERLCYYNTSIARMISEGHEIGYHSYDHRDQRDLDSDTIISDYAATQEKLYEITGSYATVWRSPGGCYDQRVLDCVDLPHIYWTVDTLDWKFCNAEHVREQILEGAEDGNIILLHEIFPSTVDGVIQAVEELNETGRYEFLTVTELLSRNGTEPEPYENYCKAD